MAAPSYSGPFPNNTHSGAQSHVNRQTYLNTVPKRYRQTDGQTDDMQSHHRALR